MTTEMTHNQAERDAFEHVREALVAVFEQREGAMRLVGKAIRVLPRLSDAQKKEGEAVGTRTWFDPVACEVVTQPISRDEMYATPVHLAWRGALKACGVSEADRDAIAEVVAGMLNESTPPAAAQAQAVQLDPIDALRFGANVAETLLSIGRAIGFGRAQQILGEQWDVEHGCAPRGSMGVTVKDSPPAAAEAQAVPWRCFHCDATFADEGEAREHAQWGGPAHDDEHSAADWLLYIDKQVNKALGTPDNDPGDRARFVKIAALAVAAIESGDRLGVASSTKEGGNG